MKSFLHRTTRTTMKLTNPKNGESIETPYSTDQEAVDALLSTVENDVDRLPNFPQSLVLQKKGGNRKLSESQRFWLHKLAIAEPPKAIATVDLSGLQALFNTAHANLKHPRIVIAHEGKEIKISRAGSRSRYAGQIMIASPQFGDAYYGRIDQQGALFAGKSMTADVEAKIQDLAADPAKFAAEYGKVTGCCCFCNKELSTEESLAVGYGPSCAKHFALPWGKSQVTKRNQMALGI